MGEAEPRITDQPIRRSATGRFTLDFDIRHRDPSTVTVLAVEEVDGTSVEEMEPLHHSVDPAALDALFDPNPDGSLPSGVTVRFEFEGYDVTIESHGLVVLERI